MIRRPSTKARLLPTALFVAASCGGGETPVLTPQPTKPVTTPEPPPAPFLSPAHWAFHPPSPAEAVSTTKLDDGACLITTAEGFRFRAEKTTKDAKCTGKTLAAPDAAPEPLVGLAKRSPTSWLFVGRSGALYEAEGPLAPLRSVIAPPPARSSLTKVSGGKGNVLATNSHGDLLRLTDTDGWQQITLPSKGIFDVAVDDEGHAIALGMPEALYTSEDGINFKAAANVGNVGVRRLGQTEDGSLVAVGVTSSIVWEPKKSKPPEQRTASIAHAAFALDLTPALFPTATSVLEGRAAIDGDRYFEVVVGEEGSGMMLASGSLEGPLEAKPLAGTKSCKTGRIGARGRHIAIVCLTMPDDDGKSRADIRISHDAGATFTEPQSARSDDEELVSVAVGSEGNVLITGLCKAEMPAGGCSGSPPLLVSPTGEQKTLGLAATPPLRGWSLSPAFSIDGGSAYFLGHRAKDDRLALYVSHDAGATFTERTLDPTKGQAEARPTEDGEIAPPDEPDQNLEPSDMTSLRPGDDGTVGIVLMTSRGLAYLTTDEDGRALGVGRAPVDNALISGAGRHVLATAFLSGHEHALDDAAAAWESQDGGLTWSDVATNVTLARELLEGSLTMACSTHGCFIGTTMSRIGWRGQATAAEIQAPHPPELRQMPQMRMPIVCELDPRTGWTRIENVDPIGAFGLPTVDQLARGRALWSVLSVDPATNAVTTTAALTKERGEGEATVTTRVLLPAQKAQNARFAMDVSHQMEGYAAIRVRLPKETGASTPLRDIEVAWENYVDGVSGRARIPDAGALVASDVKHESRRELFDTALISVTPGSIFVRPHNVASSNPLTFLLDPRGKRTTFSYPTWASILPKGAPELRSDAALIEGQPLAVGTLVDDDISPLTMLLAKQEPGATWVATATTLAPGSTVDNLRLSRNDWTYLGPSTIGALVAMSEPQEGLASASFYPFRADGGFGPAIAVPTPLDLSDPPRPCKADDRRLTPRFAARAFWQGQVMYPGRRHPVLVAESPSAKPPLTDPVNLLSAGAVLYGTKASPCVAAFEAFGVASSGVASSGRVPVFAVIAGDGKQAWLFRAATQIPIVPKDAGKPASETRSFAIEHRPMSCRFDGNASVPNTLFGQPGTTVWAPP